MSSEACSIQSKQEVKCVHRQALGKVQTLGCLQCTEVVRKGSSLGWAMSTGRRFPVQTAPCETWEQGVRARVGGQTFFFDPQLKISLRDMLATDLSDILFMPNLELGSFASCTAETEAPVTSHL